MTAPCDDTVEIYNEPVSTLEIITEGPQGPIGPEGPPGSTGPSGAHYVHTQISPATHWVINHSLGTYLNITVVDTSGTVVEGDISYPTDNQIVVDFLYPFAGEAYIS